MHVICSFFYTVVKCLKNILNFFLIIVRFLMWAIAASVATPLVILSKWLSKKCCKNIDEESDDDIKWTQIPHFEHDSEFTSSMWRLYVHLVSVTLYYIGILYMAFRAIWIQPTQSIWHYLFPWHYFIC